MAQSGQPHAPGNYKNITFYIIIIIIIITTYRNIFLTFR
jgi:hypothetical protein